MKEQFAFCVRYDSVERQIRTHVQLFAKFAEGADVSKHPNYIAVWDTGAKITTVSNKLIEKLNPQRRGTITSRGVGGKSTHGVFKMDILLPTGTCVRSMPVMAGELDGFDVLIGMDIISQGDMSILNGGGRTTFTFRLPPSDPVEEKPGIVDADEYFVFPRGLKCYLWKSGYSKFKAILQILLGR